MLGMFWIALELSNPMLGLITRLSLPLKNLIASKFGGVAKSGNAATIDLKESTGLGIKRFNNFNKLNLKVIHAPETVVSCKYLQTTRNPNNPAPLAQP